MTSASIAPMRLRTIAEPAILKVIFGNASTFQPASSSAAIAGVRKPLSSAMHTANAYRSGTLGWTRP